MRRKRIVISLIVMIVISLMFAVNAFATGEPTVITTITAGNSTATPSSTGASGTPTPITPSSGSGTVPLATESSTGAPATNGTTQISAGNTAPATNSPANAAATSSYRDLASNTNTSGLPYTGSSYGIVFVILALVISAVYAYKKVTDYNM